MITFPGYQISCSRAVWKWEGSSLGTAENFARIVSIFLTLQAPLGQLENKEVWGGNPVLLTPRFCQALMRQDSEAPVSRSCSSYPGPLTMQEGKLRPRGGLICPGHTVKQHLTHTLATSSHSSFPSLAASTLCWGRLGMCSPLPRQSWLAPLAQAAHCRRLPSIFCPPHLSENHEEKSLPSLCLSCHCDIWPPSEPPPPVGTLLLPRTPQGWGQGDGVILSQLTGCTFIDIQEIMPLPCLCGGKAV